MYFHYFDLNESKLVMVTDKGRKKGVVGVIIGD